MRLYDVQPGSTAKVRAIIKTPDGEKKDLLFDTVLERVVDPKIGQMGYLARAIKVNDVIVNFGKVQVQLIVTNNADKRIYACSCVEIKSVKVGEEKYHLIRSDRELKIWERRSTLRLSLIEKAQVKFNDDPYVDDAFTQDISMTGISLKMLKNPNIKVGNTIHGSFKYNNNIFFIEGKIVRIASEDDRYIIFGCRFDNESQAINKLVIRLMTREKQFRD